MKKTLTILALLPLLTSAQITDVLFLNEGYYNLDTQTQEQSPSLGVYSGEDGTYSVVYNFEESGFLSDGLIHNGIIYIAADTKIILFSAADYSYLDQIDLVGVRDLAVYDNFLIATRGESMQSFDSYVHIYDLNNLSLVAALPNDGVDGPEFTSEDVKVIGQKAYICVSNSFFFGSFQSIIGVYDFTDDSYSQIDLGQDGVNPENLMINDDSIYAFCNHSYDKSSIARLDLQSLDLETAYVANNGGCALSAVIDEKIYYQEYSLNKIARFDLESFSIQDTLENQAFYSLAQDPQSGDIWASSTDYFSSGAAHLIDPDGNEMNSFEIGISCGNILFNETETVSLNEVDEYDFRVYPNPSLGAVIIEWIDFPAVMEVYGVEGKLVTTEQILTSRTELNLSSGVYLIRAIGETTSPIRRVVIE